MIKTNGIIHSVDKCLLITRDTAVNKEEKSFLHEVYILMGMDSQYAKSSHMCIMSGSDVLVEESDPGAEGGSVGWGPGQLPAGWSHSVFLRSWRLSKGGESRG